jgi:hypothetical protein
MVVSFDIPNVGVLGDAGAGKDTLAAQLMQHQGYKRRAFADQLKIDVYEMLFSGSSRLDPPNMSEEEMIEHINERKQEPEMRAMLQAYGVFMRRYRNHAHWSNQVNMWILQQRNDNPGVHLVIPDVRFPNEVDMLRNMGFIIVKVDRPGLVSTLTSEQRTHSSERALDNIEPDVILTNDDTPYDLYLQFMRSCSLRGLQRV